MKRGEAGRYIPPTGTGVVHRACRVPTCVLRSTVRGQQCPLGLEKAEDSGDPAEGSDTCHPASHLSGDPLLQFPVNMPEFPPLKFLSASHLCEHEHLPRAELWKGARRGTQMRGLMRSRVLTPAPSALNLSLLIWCNGPLVARGGLQVGGQVAGSHSGGHLSWSQPCTC